nr:hypothetical protein [Corynebacterium pseudotuberculosis]
MVNAEEEFQRRVENLEKQRQAAVNNYADFAKEFRATVARRMEEFERELKSRRRSWRKPVSVGRLVRQKNSGVIGLITRARYGVWLPIAEGVVV